ncbi:MAG: hypothetical protein K1000chlam1_01137 [Candidatus Anoxychlamydiales bacterium]|nr:hypothetical protein [Candidatus Anoxychlamydiales bacterium]
MKDKPIKIIIICFICFFMGMAWTVLPTISNLLLNDSISKSEYSILTFTLVFAGLIFSSIAGVLGRIKGLKNVLVSGVFLCIIAMVFYALGCYQIKHLYVLLLIGQFILGLGITSILTSLAAYLSLYIPKATAMVLTGIFACVNIGSFTCPIFFNLFNQNKWGNNSIIIAAGFFVLFLIALKVLPVVKNPYTESKSKKSFFKKEYLFFWLFFLTLALYSVCELVYSYWGIIYLNQYKQFNLELSRFSLSFYWIAVGLGQLTICWLLKYIAPKYFYRVLPILIAIGFWGMFFSKELTSVIISFVIGGLGASAFIALTMNFVEIDFKEIAEIASGVMFMGYFLGYLIGSLAIAQAIKFTDLSKIFLFSGFLAIIIELFTLYLVKKSRIPKGYH